MVVQADSGGNCPFCGLHWLDDSHLLERGHCSHQLAQCWGPGNDGAQFVLLGESSGLPDFDLGRLVAGIWGGSSRPSDDGDAHPRWARQHAVAFSEHFLASWRTRLGDTSRQLVGEITREEIVGYVADLMERELSDEAYQWDWWSDLAPVQLERWVLEEVPGVLRTDSSGEPDPGWPYLYWAADAKSVGETFVSLFSPLIETMDLAVEDAWRETREQFKEAWPYED
jgi:hypothetical protein